MKKKQFQPERETYTAPWSIVIQLESEGFVCTSIEHEAQNSTEEEWNNEEEEEGEDLTW